MTANELRIGNLIYGYIENNEDVEGEEIECLVKVVALDSAGITDYSIWVEGISYKDDHEYYGAFNPIPLTEEWLLKFGFEDLRHSGEQLFELIHNDIIGYRFSMEGQYGYPEIKYVHQLQNLYFALTGKELQLTN